MSRMGEEMEKRLDANKYWMYEALVGIRKLLVSNFLAEESLEEALEHIHRIAERVLTKIEGG
ncbi:hypothetical protein LCGC14_1692130 [marine sediment metagenome]|uniref:HEPN domain-containing protein n=1 Tax=marine sediment metagenome TaxID=412755 RepID=A0A0F9K101_9ZZZZ